jgi:hypothetical protein
MRVLLDENIDRFLKGLFADEFEVMTVSDCGWQGKGNGDRGWHAPNIAFARWPAHLA